MRRHQHSTVASLLALSLCLALSPLPSFAQQSPTAGAADQDKQLASIAGSVVSAGTSDPLKKARVVLVKDNEQPTHPQIAITDATGHFSIDHLAAGRYNLAVDRTGYIPQSYGQDQPDKPGAILTLEAGQKISDLIFRLQRMAVIAGRVLDEDGDPVPNATIEILSRPHSRKDATPQFTSQATTNDLGEYRIFDLLPGHYYVRASPQRAYMTTDDSSSAETAQLADASYAPSYYPGAADFARASVIDVKAGDETAGIDFVLAPKGDGRTYKIKGHVSNSITGHPDARVFVIATPRNGEAVDFGENQNVEPDAKTGDFEIKGLAPGAYTVVAAWLDGGKFRGARQDVDVNAADADGVSLVLTNGIDIPGRVTLDGRVAAAADHITVTLSSKSSEQMFNSWQEAKVLPDGSFVLSGVGDGDYSINVNSKCAECYLKSATANGADLLDKGVDVASGSAPSEIDLVYSSNTGTANGTVTNKDDLPAAGAFVVLVRDAARAAKSERSRSSTTDQYGHFEIRGIPPGKYTAFAWEKIVEGDNYEDPDFLKPFENQGQSIDISANDRQSIQIKLIPASATDSQN